MINAYTIYDKKAATYIPPFFGRTNRDAIEVVEPLLALRGGKLAEFPEDFILYRIGEFDPLTGVFVSCPPEVVCEVAFIASQQPTRSTVQKELI